MDKLKLGVVILLALIIICATVLVALDKMPWSALATIFGSLVAAGLTLIDPRALTGSASAPSSDRVA